MPKPTECRYCGCKEQRFGHFSDDHMKFKCGTVSCSNGIWSIGSKCHREILGQVVDMRERIHKADEVLASLPHSLMTPFWREKYLSQMTPDQRQLVDAVDKVREILKGESTEG